MKKVEFVKARVVPVRQLGLGSRVQMYRIFQTYYDGASWDQFQHDLSEKNDVILLENIGGSICGFSTLQWKTMEVGGQSVIGVFSGDTILEQKYWGNPALGIKFLSYLWELKLKNLGKPVYWFLISKGYKTYLLMANNFAHSYPHFLRQTPSFEQKLMDKFYADKFGDLYVPERGIISLAQGPTCKLKHQVAPITETLKITVPSVGYFAHKNPNWAGGDELACIAKMTLGMPVRYALKKVIIEKARKLFGSRQLKGASGDRRVSPIRLGPQYRRESYGQ